MIAASSFALVAALLASPLGWIQYTLFLLPVLLTHWHRPAMRVVAALLIIPVPFIIGQLDKPAWTQITTGSVYGWAVVLCLAILIAAERRRMQPEGSRLGMLGSKQGCSGGGL